MFFLFHLQAINIKRSKDLISIPLKNTFSSYQYILWLMFLVGTLFLGYDAFSTPTIEPDIKAS